MGNKYNGQWTPLNPRPTPSTQPPPPPPLRRQQPSPPPNPPGFAGWEAANDVRIGSRIASAAPRQEAPTIMGRLAALKALTERLADPNILAIAARLEVVEQILGIEHPNLPPR